MRKLMWSGPKPIQMLWMLLFRRLWKKMLKEPHHLLPQSEHQQSRQTSTKVEPCCIIQNIKINLQEEIKQMDDNK